MGLAKYTEDIIRTADELAFAANRGIAACESAGRSDLAAELKQVTAKCEQAIKTLQEELRLAADPSVDLAHEVISLRKKLGDARIAAAEFTKRCEGEDERIALARKDERERLRKHVKQMELDYGTNARIEIGELRRELKECKRELKRLGKAFKGAGKKRE